MNPYQEIRYSSYRCTFILASFQLSNSRTSTTLSNVSFGYETTLGEYVCTCSYTECSSPVQTYLYLLRVRSSAEIIVADICITLWTYLLSEILSDLRYGANSKSITLMYIYFDTDFAEGHHLLSLCLDYVHVHTWKCWLTVGLCREKHLWNSNVPGNTNVPYCLPSLDLSKPKSFNRN